MPMKMICLYISDPDSDFVMGGASSALENLCVATTQLTFMR